MSNIIPPPQKHGQFKLQGIFGEPVVADLVDLPVSLFDINAENQASNPVSLLFAVTSAIVQDCDLIIPAQVVNTLQNSSTCEGKPDSVEVNMITRGQAKAKKQSESNSEEPQSNQYSNPYKVEQQLSSIADASAESPNTKGDLNANDMVRNNTDDPRLVLLNEGDMLALCQEQRADTTLDPYWHLARRGRGGMVVEDDLLYHYDEVGGHRVKQLCVPFGRRLQVMRLAHDTIAAGHLASRKTLERIRLNFFWPNTKTEVCSYTSSCVACQLRARARRKDHVPIMPMVRPTVPFVVCHADVIGPIEPPSAQGHKWALCIIDDCTRCPAVYLLKSLTAKATCQAFMELFSLTGWPEVLCTDQNSNFCSHLTQEFLNRMGVSPRINSPYHPEASGVIERFNATFKNMLNHAIHDYGRQWHKAVPCLVWALREVPNRTTSVSPHFLLFGRVPRGPLSILHEAWTGEREYGDDDSKPVNQYIQDLETDMQNARRYAHLHANAAQQQYTEQYNKHAKDKSFQVGQQVVVLEKDSTHKTFARWKQGTITRVRSPYSYEVQLSDGACRWLHANKLRPFVARVQNVGVIKDQDAEFGEAVSAPLPTACSEQLPSKYIDENALSHLNVEQQNALLSVLDQFADVFSDTPGLCTVVQHEINVTVDFKPRVTRAYRVPETLKREIERQVAELLELGFIVPSKSSMVSGVVCVLKPDKSIRMASDYRYLNSYRWLSNAKSV